MRRIPWEFLNKRVGRIRLKIAGVDFKIGRLGDDPTGGKTGRQIVQGTPGGHRAIDNRRHTHLGVLGKPDNGVAIAFGTQANLVAQRVTFILELRVHHHLMVVLNSVTTDQLHVLANILIPIQTNHRGADLFVLAARCHRADCSDIA